MYKLSPEQRRYLMASNMETRASTLSKASASKAVNNHAHQASTFSSASGSGIIPRLVPQLTGDSGIMKRFSIVGWGTGSPSPPSTSPRSSSEFGSIQGNSLSKSLPAQSSEVQPLQPQSTGGLWNSWWASSGGEKGTASKIQDKETEKTPEWYVEGIKSGKSSDMKLVKHLISLRVHLSTASLTWVEIFVSDCKGFDALGSLLSGLVAKGGKRKRLLEVEETVLLEVIKSVRVLLNTDVRFLVHVNDFNDQRFFSQASSTAFQMLR